MPAQKVLVANVEIPIGSEFPAHGSASAESARSCKGDRNVLHMPELRQGACLRLGTNVCGFKLGNVQAGEEAAS